MAAKNKPLEIAYRSTDSLVPYARNARTHSEAQIAAIAGSVREFGFTNPVLIDEEGGIIAGHGRVLAAQKLKLLEVPTITLTGLTPIQRRAYVLADNKLALDAGWDVEMLALELQELIDAGLTDMDLTGFSGKEIEELLAGATADFDPVGAEEQGQLDKLEPKLATCPKCGHAWDLRADEQA